MAFLSMLKSCTYVPLGKKVLPMKESAKMNLSVFGQ